MLYGVSAEHRPVRRPSLNSVLSNPKEFRRANDDAHETARGLQPVYAPGWSQRTTANTTAAISADAGMVKIHAHTIRRAIPHRTADSRLVAPTPIMAPVIVWVVLTGMPANAVANSVMAPAVSAQKPPTGLSFVMREPMVCTILHPPKYVPRAIAACAARMMGQ